jgi:hypothetical protein
MTRFQKDAVPARSLPSVPLNVEFTGDVMDMTKDWSEDESKYQRRHVAFSHSVEGDTLKIKPLVSRRPSIFVSPPNTTLMIHCIARKTAKGHLADFCFASFDLTRLIEGLCRRYFTSEEKKQLRAQCKPFPGVYLDPTAEPGRTLCPLLTELHQSSCALTRKHFQDVVKVFPWSILPDMISYLMPLVRVLAALVYPSTLTLSQYCRVPLAARKDPLVMWDLAQKQPVSVLPERPPNRRPSRLQPAPLKHRQSTMTYGYESSDTDSIDSDGQLRKKRRRPASSSSSGRSSASSEAEVEAPDSSGIDSPIPAELVPLETFLNNQNPGLGAAAGALLREQGITAQAQFSMFRTVEWWSQFHATHLVGKGLSALDE